MFEAARFGDEVSHSNALLGFLRGRCGTGAGCCRVGIHYIHRWVRRMPAGRCAVGRGGILGGMMANIGESIGAGMSSPTGAIRSVARNVYINSRLAAEVQAKGLGSNLGNIKVSKKPLLEDVQKEKVSPEVYDKLRKRTPSTAIRKMVNKDVSLPMKDPALPEWKLPNRFTLTTYNP